MNHKKFELFLESLETEDNEAVIGVIAEGYVLTQAINESIIDELKRSGVKGRHLLGALIAAGTIGGGMHALGEKDRNDNKRLNDNEKMAIQQYIKAKKAGNGTASPGALDSLHNAGVNGIRLDDSYGAPSDKFGYRGKYSFKEYDENGNPIRE